MSGNFDTKPFREALGAFTTGITIVTSRDQDGQDVGLTANSFNSVSLDPPMVLWSLARTSLSLKAFKTCKHFAVHILAADQESISNLFATRGAEKFAGIELSRGRGDVPLLPGCSARFECEKAFEYEGGDHEIFVGEVVAFDDYKKDPLVFQAGKYAVAVEKPVAIDLDSTPDQPDGSFGKDSLLFALGVAHHQLQAQLRPGLETFDIDTNENAVLMTLLVRDGRSESEMTDLLRYMGHDAPSDIFRELVEKDLISLSHEGVFYLTESGRNVSIRVMAMTKAVEEDAEEMLDYGEKELLRRYLRAVIRGTTDSGQKTLWSRREPGNA